MPIGSAKIGVLGAGLVPGGTTTFNASGTFTVPPGVKKVNITGKGGTGNPGNAGNSGNAGNPGTGGAGGAGGTAFGGCGPKRGFGGNGGWAFKDFFCTNRLGYPAPFPFWNCAIRGGQAPTCLFGPQAPKMTIGGAGGCGPTPCGTAPNGRKCGQNGASGNAGSAGNAGNPGNTGGTSSGLCKNFTGGAGGNAGVAGAAGNGGTGGNVGTIGNLRGNTSPAPGGNGGGAGGAGANYPGPNSNSQLFGGGGGGGAGTNTDGSAGQGTAVLPGPTNTPLTPVLGYARGGDGCVTAPVNPGGPAAFQYPTPGPAPASVVGGMGGGRAAVNGGVDPAPSVGRSSGFGLQISPACPGPRGLINQWSPVPLTPSILRAGAGGGAISGISFTCIPGSTQFGSGGGGGGRGNAGNAGGASPTPSGAAATPSTFNCVPVTPGSPYPITVASPGGQIVISWNPQ